MNKTAPLSTSHIVIWVVFLSVFSFLFFFFLKRIMEIRKIKAIKQKEYDQKKKKYSHLKPGIFDDIPKDDVLAAAIFHCLNKEDEDFDHYFEKMNESERIVFGIYQLTLLIQRDSTLHSFFLNSKTKHYVPMVAEMFESVGSQEIADLMKAARRFFEIIENDEDDEEMGDYARYNFSDFTHEFVTLVNTTNLNDKITDFILLHKEDFYDYDFFNKR